MLTLFLNFFFQRIPNGRETGHSNISVQSMFCRTIHTKCSQMLTLFLVLCNEYQTALWGAIRIFQCKVCFAVKSLLNTFFLDLCNTYQTAVRGANRILCMSTHVCLWKSWRTLCGSFIIVLLTSTSLFRYCASFFKICSTLTNSLRLKICTTHTNYSRSRKFCYTLSL